MYVSMYICIVCIKWIIEELPLRKLPLTIYIMLSGDKTNKNYFISGRVYYTFRPIRHKKVESIPSEKI